MGKDIGRIYKYSQSQPSTLLPKARISSSSYPQTSPAIKLKTASVPSIRDKNQNNYVMYSQNTIHNYANITNNDGIQSCDTLRKLNYCIPTILTPNHHTQHIATTYPSILNLYIPTILPLAGNNICVFGRMVKLPRPQGV